MKRRRFHHLLRGVTFGVCALSLLAVFAGPAQAGTVYVPLTIDGEAGGIGVRTDVWIANTTNKAIELSSYFIPTLTDGTDRPDDAGNSIQIAARGTLRLEGVAPAGEVGITELDLPDGVIVTARLVTIHPQLGETLGTEMPVLSGANLIPAGTTAHVQGWEREEGRVLTDFGAVNLSANAAQCQVSVFRGNGQQISTTATFPIQPLTSVHFPAALGILGQKDVPIARAQVTCDQEFYPYAVVTDIESGELVFHGPSARGEDGLLPPGAAPECSPLAAQCFVRSGVFHQPTPANPVKRLEFFPSEGGGYSKMVVRLTVVHGGWFPGKEDKTHNIFWLARAQKNRNLYGYVNVQGPGKNKLFNRHGLGVPQEEKGRMEGGLQLTPGKAYTFEYVYDAGNRTITLTVTDASGTVLSRLAGRTTTNTIDLGPDAQATMDFGFVEGLNPNEPPTYGWKYQDLTLELYR